MQTSAKGGYVCVRQCDIVSTYAAAVIEAFICFENVSVSACVGVRVEIFGTKQARPPRPSVCPSVPPDVTLLSAGSHPAAEVGRLTAPLLWVGERWLGEGMGWHPGNPPNIRQIQACVL